MVEDAVPAYNTTEKDDTVEMTKEIKRKKCYNAKPAYGAVFATACYWPRMALSKYDSIR